MNSFIDKFNYRKMKVRQFLFIILVTLTILDTINAKLEKQKDCKCRASGASRIVKGREALRGEYPWMLSVQRKDTEYTPVEERKKYSELFKIKRHVCGAILLNTEWALTASHCIPKKNETEMKTSYEIGFGQNDLVEMYDTDQYVGIERAILHPKFSLKGEVQNDIALLKLKNPIKFTKYTQPACLPTNETHTYDGVLKTIGFGATQTVSFWKWPKIQGFAEPHRFLKEANLMDQSHHIELCKEIKDTFICVENTGKTGESACKGDSGGPLHYQKNGKTQVIGIISFSERKYYDSNRDEFCAGAGANTRVSSYLNFIEEHIGDDYCV